MVVQLVKVLTVLKELKMWKSNRSSGVNDANTITMDDKCICILTTSKTNKTSEF